MNEKLTHTLIDLTDNREEIQKIKLLMDELFNKHGFNILNLHIAFLELMASSASENISYSNFAYTIQYILNEIKNVWIEKREEGDI